MFPDVRLMIAATVASVVVLTCGLGLFAAFRVQHGPLVRLSPAPLQLAANGAAAPLAAPGPLPTFADRAASPRDAQRESTDAPAAAAHVADAPDHGVAPLGAPAETPKLAAVASASVAALSPTQTEADESAPLAQARATAAPAQAEDRAAAVRTPAPDPTPPEATPASIEATATPTPVAAVEPGPPEPMAGTALPLSEVVLPPIRETSAARGSVHRQVRKLAVRRTVAARLALRRAHARHLRAIAAVAPEAQTFTQAQPTFQTATPSFQSQPQQQRLVRPVRRVRVAVRPAVRRYGGVGGPLVAAPSR